MSEATAWARVEAAIEGFLEELGVPGLLLDWGLVVHKVVALEDGSNEASTSYFGAELQPAYRAQGLLAHAMTQVSTEVARDTPRGDEE